MWERRKDMRRYLFCLAVALLIPVSQAHASRVGVSVGINIGIPAVVAPVYAPQPVVLEEPPEFIAPPELGFYVAEGVPYDLFFVSNRYYLCRGNVWYSAPYYNGPWVSVGYSSIPYGIRRFPFERIHYFRDNYYRHFSNDRYGYEYRHFRPGSRSWGRSERDYRGGVNYGSWHGAANPGWNRPTAVGWNRPGYVGGGRPSNTGWRRTDHGGVNRPAATGGNRPGHGSENRHGSDGRGW